MSGGKGGSTTSSVTIPEYIEAAAQRNLNKAERISQIGYTPYYGPDVAAFTPMQQAGFQNIADTAGAFGMAAPTTQQDIMGGMGPATTYAGGVQGYSSAPIYEEALQTLGERRPGQKAYIDSFFINPYTGGATAGNFAPIDYTSYGTMADQAAAERQNQLNIAALQRPPSSTLTQGETMQLGNIVAPGSGYNPMTDTLTAEQQAYVNDPANVAARIAQDDLAMSITGDANSNIIDAGKGLFNVEPSFKSPSSASSYGGSLVTGGLSGDFTPIPGITGNIADNIVASVSPEYAMGQQGKDFAASGGSTYNPSMSIVNPISGQASSGGYDFDPTAFSSSYNGSNSSGTLAPPTPDEVDLPGNAISRALNIGSGAKDSSTDSGYAGSSNDGCVVATHAVNSGAFSPATKREAVVWCMQVLHGKWWGEAIRRGYRHLGRKKIEQGKAADHYQEFRNYIDFARGKKRTIKGAIHFAARTAQFFAVGLVKKDS